MKYTINIKELIPRGYQFQKLYANNYKTYHKKINSRMRIWIFVKGCEIEVNDWFDNTENLIKFYIENKENPIFNEFSPISKGPKNYAKVQMNPNTGFVQFFDDKLYFGVFDKARNLPENRMSEAWADWNQMYKNWYNEIILSHDSMKELIEEINYLTGRNLWKEYCVK